MNSRYSYIVIACTGVMLILIGCGIGVFVGVQAGIFSDDTTPTVSAENPDRTSTPRRATSTANASKASPTPSATTTNAQNIAQQIFDSTVLVEGVQEVTAVNVTEFDDGWIVFLEVNTLQGYSTQATADIIKGISDVIAADVHLEFSVVLWDKINRATNYTWDTENQEWHTTVLSNNPS